MRRDVPPDGAERRRPFYVDYDGDFIG